MNDYIFRRELDFASFLPEVIIELKNSRHFRKMVQLSKTICMITCTIFTKSISFQTMSRRKKKAKSRTLQRSKSWNEVDRN